MNPGRRSLLTRGADVCGALVLGVFLLSGLFNGSALPFRWTRQATAAPTPVDPVTIASPSAEDASAFLVSTPAAKRVAATRAAVEVAGLVTDAYGPDPAQLIDIHPSEIWTTTPAPAILYFHSGGWSSGDRGSVPDVIAAQAARGWVVLSADYRLAPEHPFPAADEDVDRAIRWVKANAAVLGIDPQRIVLAGGSAGGHLATVAAASPGRFVADDLPVTLAAIDPTPAGLLALVAPTDLVALHRDSSTGRDLLRAYLGCPVRTSCSITRLGLASPLEHVTAAAPPALFVYGELDTLVPPTRHGDPIVAAWRAAGRRADELVVGGAGHNLDARVLDQAFVDAFVDRAVRR